MADDTNIFDGKIRIKSAETSTFDGRVLVNQVVNVLDGKAVIKDTTVNLFDGSVLVKFIGPSYNAWSSIAPATQWALPLDQARREIYLCILRKAGYDDVELPMSSMQLRRRSGDPTLVSCVVPDAITYLDYAQDREGGEIIIQSGSETADGTRHLSELERAGLDSISYARGVGSSSLILSGYRTETNDNPRQVEIEAATYYGLQADGARRIRSAVNIFLRPGDTILLGIESFTVEQIYIAVEPGNAWMEVTGI